MIEADLVLTGGKILTVDDRFSIVSALAVRGDRIIAVGDDAAMKPLIGPKTRVVELKGRTVIPGLHDSHMHTMNGGNNGLRRACRDGEEGRLDHGRQRLA